MGDKDASDLDIVPLKGMSEDTGPIDDGINKAKNGLDDLEKGLKDLLDQLDDYDESLRKESGNDLNKLIG